MAHGLLARERFEQTREDVKRLHEVQLKLMFNCEDWKPPQIKAQNEMTDPTANRAIYNVDELGGKLERLREEESELLERIGVALAIVQGVRDGLGERYADVLEARYIDCWEWKRVKEELKIKKSTGHNLLSIAFDWIDSVGVSRLLRGDVEV